MGVWSLHTCIVGVEGGPSLSERDKRISYVASPKCGLEFQLQPRSQVHYNTSVP